MESLAAVLRLAENHLSRVREELQPELFQVNPSGSFRTGTWVNSQGLGAAYLTYALSSDPAQEGIDSVISVQLKDNHVDVTIDVAESSGTVIADIVDLRLPMNITDALHVELDRSFSVACDEITARLRDYLRTA